MILGIYEREPPYPPTALDANAQRTLMHGAWFDYTDALGEAEAAAKLNLYKYANAKRLQVEQQGFVFQGAHVPTDTHAISLMLMGSLVMAPAETTPYISDGVDYGDFSGSTVKAMAEALVVFLRSTFVTLRTVHAGIRAGSIATTQDIDAAFANP